MRRLLVFTLLVVACGPPGTDGAGGSTGNAGDGGTGAGGTPVAAGPCEEATALEASCLERLATACEDADGPACKRACYPFTLKVQEVCRDAEPTPCARLSAEVEACFERIDQACADLKSELETCEASADEVCALLTGDPGREDPELVAACNEATAACWIPKDRVLACRIECVEPAARATIVCGGG